MYYKKLGCFIIGLLIFTGCSSQNTAEIETLNQTIKQLETEVQTIKEENTALKQSFEGYDYSQAMTFKDVINIRAKVLDKQPGDDLYPYYILVTMDDVDHNTPLLLTTDQLTMYDSLKEGETYDLKVFVQVVIDRENDVIRFMYTLMP